MTICQPVKCTINRNHNAQAAVKPASINGNFKKNTIVFNIILPLCLTYSINIQ